MAYTKTELRRQFGIKKVTLAILNRYKVKTEAELYQALEALTEKTEVWYGVVNVMFTIIYRDPRIDILEGTEYETFTRMVNQSFLINTRSSASKLEKHIQQKIDSWMEMVKSQGNMNNMDIPTYGLVIDIKPLTQNRKLVHKPVKMTSITMEINGVDWTSYGHMPKGVSSSYFMSSDGLVGTIHIYRIGDEYNSMDDKEVVTYGAKDEKKSYTLSSKVINSLPAEIDSLIEKAINDQSFLYDGHITGYTIKMYDVNHRELSDIKMKDAMAFKLSMNDNIEWDNKEGTCVLDFLAHRYGNPSGKMIKACRKDKLIESFKEIQKQNDNDDEYDEYDPLTHGVSSRMLMEWCKMHEIPMYALDEDEKVFLSYRPSNESRKHRPTLAFRLCDKHLYPVTDTNEIKSIANVSSGKSFTRASDVVDKKIVRAEKSTIMVPYNEWCGIKTVGVSEKESRFRYMIQKVTEKGVRPRSKSIRVDGNGSVLSFELEGDSVYILCEPEGDMIKSMMENMGEKYKGQSLQGAAMMVLHKEKEKIPKSICNPAVMETLSQKNVMHRVHVGFTKGWDITRLRNQKKTVLAQDIRRCYTSCMYDPTEEWMLLDIMDQWEPYRKSLVIKQGLYNVETKDFSLLRGDNVYSASILRKARDEGIAFSIKYQLIPSHKAPKDFFKKVIDKIKELAPSEQCEKLCSNMLSGMMGKHTVKISHVSLTKDADTLWSWFMKNRTNANNIWMDDIDEEWYLAGNRVIEEMSENNLPMYIQILDDSNIRLFDMVKSMGGELVYRKTDCAVVVNSKLPLSNIGENPGQYKVCSVPNVLSSHKYVKPIVTLEKSWEIAEVCDSNEYEKVLNMLDNGKGLMLSGCAGTGKTYVANLIADKYGESCARIALTHKACELIDGRTIHNFLGMRYDGKVSLPRLRHVMKDIKVILIEEISMIPAELWKKLMYIKKNFGVMFVLVGDYRQCLPVEDGKGKHYFDNSMIKRLVDFQRVNLTTIHRYDLELAERLQNVEEFEADFKDCRLNLAFFNATCMRINMEWMDKEKQGKEYVHVAYNSKYEGSQETYLFAGLPVIGCCNKDGVINSKRYEVEKVIIKGKSVVEDGILYMDGGRFIVNGKAYAVEDFPKYFNVGYCCTVHKVQGETLEDDYCIYDYNVMDNNTKYTALSRARKLAQIYIKKGGDWDREMIGNIKKKLYSHEKYDTEKGLTHKLGVSDVIAKIQKQGVKCYWCRIEMKTSWQGGDEGQFTIDRLNNNLGHTKKNCVMACWKCNRNRQLEENSHSRV